MSFRAERIKYTLRLVDYLDVYIYITTHASQSIQKKKKKKNLFVEVCAGWNVDSLYWLGG
jgi:hypothetical protein